MKLGELIEEAKSLVGEEYTDVVLTVMVDGVPASVNSIQTALASNNAGDQATIMILECLDDDEIISKSIDMQTQLISQGHDYRIEGDAIIPIYKNDEDEE